MNHECDVVKDLSSLYAEDLLSDGTLTFIEEHCQSCASCRQLLATIKEAPLPTTDDDTKNKVWAQIARKEHRKKTVKHILLTALAVMLVVGGVFFYAFMVKGNTWFVEYDAGASAQYLNAADMTEHTHPGRDEVEAAAQAVKQYFTDRFAGAVLLRLAYNEKLTLDEQWHEHFPGAIIFDSDYYYFRKPTAGNGFQMQRGWHWTVMRDESNQWKVVSGGYL